MFRPRVFYFVQSSMLGSRVLSFIMLSSRFRCLIPDDGSMHGSRRVGCLVPGLDAWFLESWIFVSRVECSVPWLDAYAWFKGRMFGSWVGCLFKGWMRMPGSRFECLVPGMDA